MTYLCVGVHSLYLLSGLQILAFSLAQSHLESAYPKDQQANSVNLAKTNQKPTTISAVSQWQMRVEIMLLLWNSGRWIERSKDGGISCDESCEIAAKKTEQDRVGSKLYIMEIMFSPSCHPLEEGLVHILQPSNWMCTPASPKDIVSVHQKL